MDQQLIEQPPYLQPPLCCIGLPLGLQCEACLEWIEMHLDWTEYRQPRPSVALVGYGEGE